MIRISKLWSGEHCRVEYIGEQGKRGRRSTREPESNCLARVQAMLKNLWTIINSEFFPSRKKILSLRKEKRVQGYVQGYIQKVYTFKAL